VLEVALAEMLGADTMVHGGLPAGGATVAIRLEGTAGRRRAIA
jgi:hypothetical protein